MEDQTEVQLEIAKSILTADQMNLFQRNMTQLSFIKTIFTPDQMNLFRKKIIEFEEEREKEKRKGQKKRNRENEVRYYVLLTLVFITFSHFLFALATNEISKTFVAICFFFSIFLCFIVSFKFGMSDIKAIINFIFIKFKEFNDYAQEED